jgi:hypothetical protein
MKTSPKELQAMFVRGLIENEGAELEEYHGLKILRYERNGHPCARIFKGNSSKSIANYRYRTEERREESVNYYKLTAKKNAEYRAEKKAKKAMVSNEEVEVGAVYYSSWGYEQTNIDFYEVVGKFGKKGLWFRPIASDRSFDPNFNDRGGCKAAKGVYTGEPFKKMLSDKNWINLTTYSGMCPWDGREMSWSSYH